MSMEIQLAENNVFTFTWKIEDLNLYSFQSVLKSPLFNIRTSNWTSWYLCFSDSLYLIKKGAEHYNGNIGYKIELINREGLILHSMDCERCSFTVNQEENEQHAEIYDRNFLVRWILNNKSTVTIRFIMNLSEALTDRFCACKARTKIETEQWSFRWNVRNLAIHDEISEVFPTSSTAQIKMTLSKCKTFVSIVIEGMETTKKTYIVCKIALLDVNGIVIDSRRDEHSCSEEKKFWKFPDFIKTNDLFTAGSKFMEYNCFCLFCKFSISEGATLEEVSYCSDDNPVVLEQDKNTHSHVTLQERFRRMYVQGLQTDLEVRASGQILKAHKCILSAMSPVFAAMLENHTGVVDIPDIDVKILDNLFRFMYDKTDVKLDYDSACNLMMAADKFQVTELKEICSDFLKSNLSNENVCNVLTLADEVSHEVLKECAVHFIIEYADVILTTEAWSHFIQSKYNLVTEVVKKFSFLYDFHKKY